MGLVMVLVMGGVMGWLASLFRRAHSSRAVFVEMAIGVIGALIAGLLFLPLVGGAPINSGSIDVPALITYLLGAVIFLAIVNLVRHGDSR